MQWDRRWWPFLLERRVTSEGAWSLRSYDTDGYVACLLTTLAAVPEGFPPRVECIFGNGAVPACICVAYEGSLSIHQGIIKCTGRKSLSLPSVMPIYYEMDVCWHTMKIPCMRRALGGLIVNLHPPYILLARPSTYGPLSARPWGAEEPDRRTQRSTYYRYGSEMKHRVFAPALGPTWMRCRMGGVVERCQCNAHAEVTTYVSLRWRRSKHC